MPVIYAAIIREAAVVHCSSDLAACNTRPARHEASEWYAGRVSRAVACCLNQCRPVWRAFWRVNSAICSNIAFIKELAERAGNHVHLADRFQGYISSALHCPFIGLFEQDRAAGCGKSARSGYGRWLELLDPDLVLIGSCRSLPTMRRLTRTEAR